MQLNPYLNFDGNGAEAVAFYAAAIGAQIEMSMTFGEMPEQPEWVTDDVKDRLAHATLKVGDSLLMVSDTAGQEPFTGHSGVTLHLGVDTQEEGARFFEALSKGGEVLMPFEPTFWSKGFGMVKDKFGVSWMIDLG